MKIIILGGGVIGVTTAYELSRSGDHDITVVDAGTGVATEASAVNASMIAPGHAFAWASPKVPGILFKSIYRNDQAFRIRLRLDWQFWKWSAAFLKQCNKTDAQRNTIRKHALCVYSQKRLNLVVAENAIEYDRIQRGLLYLYRHPDTLKQGIRQSEILKQQGQQTEILSSDEVIDVEPAYQREKSKIAGAVYCPTDETGNAQKFTHELAAVCRQRNIKFVFNTTLHSIVMHQGRMQCVTSSIGDLRADLFVVSLGAHTAPFLRPIGINLPIYPVKGYSLTLAIGSHHQPPTIGTVDEDHLIALTRIGDSFRATSTAEFSGYDFSHRMKDFQPMITGLKELLPNAADYGQPTYRTCLRPMTPQGTPYIGFSKCKNLFINSGHGHMGWTMACGSAKIAADLIGGGQPDIETSGLQLPQ